MANPQPTPTDPSTLNDPTATLVNISSLDFLLIELVPMAYRITADLALREEEWIQGGSSTSTVKPSDATDTGSTVGVSGGGGVGGAGTVDEEEAREAVFHRLETLGYRVGLGIVERYGAPLLLSYFCSTLALWF